MNILGQFKENIFKNSKYFHNIFELIIYKMHSFFEMSYVILMKTYLVSEILNKNNLKITFQSKKPVLFSSFVVFLFLFHSFSLSLSLSLPIPLSLPLFLSLSHSLTLSLSLSLSYSLSFSLSLSLLLSLSPILLIQLFRHAFLSITLSFYTFPIIFSLAPFLKPLSLIVLELFIVLPRMD